MHESSRLHQHPGPVQHLLAVVSALAAVACGSSSMGPDGGPTGDGGGGPRADGGGDGLGDGSVPGEPPDDLGSAAGCDGIYNPDQRLTFTITMSSGDWSSLKSDMTNSIYFPARLSCGDEAAVDVGIRRKRSGGTDKPGLKIDVDWAVADQYWHGLRKLSLENGISEGTGTAGVRDVLAEYMAWRAMDLADAMASRAASSTWW